MTWAASAYVAKDTSLMESIENGEVFKAGMEVENNMITSRFNYKQDPSYEFTNFDGIPSNNIKNKLEWFFHPRISVLLAPDEELKVLPKCYIYAMSHDILLDDASLFYNAAVNAGNTEIELEIWEGAMHIEQSFSKFWLNRSIMPQRNVRIIPINTK